MILRPFAVLAAVAAVLAPSAPAHAATLSIDMPGCSSVTLSGQPPNYTLTCTPVASVCSVVASSASPTVGSVVNLTAGCVPPAASVTWAASRGCNVPAPVTGSPMQATATQGTAINCVYTATDTTTGTVASTTVSWGAQLVGGAQAPSGCQIGVTPSASLGSGGGNVTLSGSCSGGGAVNKWTWRRDLASNVSSQQSFGDSLPANTNQAARTYTYGLTACSGANQDVCAAEVVSAVTVAGAGGGGASLCPGNAVIANMTPGVQFVTSGLAPGVIFSGRFVAPADTNGPNANPGVFYAAEWIDPPANRLMTLSTRACDFRGYSNPPVYPIPQPILPPGDPTGVNGPLAWAGGSLTSTGPSIAYLLTGDPAGSPPKPFLTPGQTYYLNIQTVNWDLSNSCSSNSCNMRIDFSIPY